MKLKGMRNDYHDDSTNRETTHDECWAVIILQMRADMPWRKISEKTDLPVRTCCTIVECYKENGRFKPFTVTFC